MAHSLPYQLPWGRRSIGFFAQQPASRLIIFVHGFGGAAVKTWKGAEALLDDERAQDADVIFYGYGSLAAPAGNSATLLRDFISVAASCAPAWQNNLRRGRAIGDRNYTDILIVAHSLGAAVTRRALLDAIEAQASWTPSARILLFGPAHMGTRLIELQAMLRSGFGAIISDLLSLARVRTPVIDDLEPKSHFIQSLIADTQKLIGTGMSRPIKAEEVIFGENENVVLIHRFGNDPIASVWPGEDHCSVCRTQRTVGEIAKHL